MASSKDTLGWLDVERIAEALHAAHPDVNPLAVRFTQLRTWVRVLPNFQEDPAHPVNERILEEIQRHWIEEQDE